MVLYNTINLSINVNSYHFQYHTKYHFYKHHTIFIAYSVKDKMTNHDIVKTLSAEASDINIYILNKNIGRPKIKS